MAWKYREVVIEDDKAIGDSGTETVDINVTEPITELVVRFKARNDTATTDDQPPERQITKLEIVDGGATYWTLPGPQAVAAACFDTGRWPGHWYDEHLSTNQNINIPLRFGRFLGDEEYGFVPSRLKNPQLKFTWADQALYLNGSLTLGVVARVMEGASPQAHCLMWKEVETWTTAASGVKSVDLPVDYPYRRVMIRAYQNMEVLYATLTHFKMDCDIGKFIPFDLDFSEFEDIVKQMFGPFEYMKLDMFDSGGIANTWMEGDENTQVGNETASHILQTYSSGWSYYMQRARNFEGADQTDSKGQVRVSGYFPHSSMCYQFGRKDDIATWFNAPEYGEIKLKITQGTASSTATVAVQQPRSLP